MPVARKWHTNTYMNWRRSLIAVLVLWSSTAWGATLTWNANSEPDLAGYRIYQCSLRPCTQSSGHALLLASTFGTGTSITIATPTVVQYFFVTAYDLANNESEGSNVVTFTPDGSSPSHPPLVGTVTLTVLGELGVTLTW